MSKVTVKPEYKDIYDKITGNISARLKERKRKLITLACIYVGIIIVGYILLRYVFDDEVIRLIAAAIVELAFIFLFVDMCLLIPYVIGKFHKNSPTRSFNLLCDKGLADKIAEQFDSSVVIPVKFNGYDPTSSLKEKKRGEGVTVADYYWRVSEDFVYVTGYGVFTYDLFKWMYQRNVTTRVNSVDVGTSSYIVIEPHSNKIGFSKVQLKFTGNKVDALNFIGRAKVKNPDLIIGFSPESKKAARRTK